MINLMKMKTMLNLENLFLVKMKILRNYLKHGILILLDLKDFRNCLKFIQNFQVKKN